MRLRRIDKALGRDAAAGDPRQLAGAIAQAWGEAESQAYYDALKTRFKVEVKASAASESGPDKSASAPAR